jgi:uncharacterized ion transporter superfamily protein YfcC
MQPINKHEYLLKFKIMEFTILEFVLIMIIWVIYGIFNSWQHDWFYDFQPASLFLSLAIILAPIALCIRIIRGVFFWKGRCN